MLNEIPAGEFKQHCLSLIDDVAMSGAELIVTKRGKPICRITPITIKDQPSIFGCLKGTVKIKGDLTLPLNETWEANE